MQVLRQGVDPDAFFRGLSEAPDRALFLDYDGTLAPFREERERAVPYVGVREALARLIEARSSRVTIVSGRWTRDLLPLLGLDASPEIWGSHGWERRRPDGSVEIGEMDDAALRGLAEADAWAEAEGLADRAEEKPGCLALHLRGLEPGEAAELRERALATFRPLAGRTGLEVHEFDGGVELRVPGRDKGDAVRAVLAELPRGAAVAYLGDDRTDEDAFAAVGGQGLCVLVRDEPRPTVADLWIRPPGELLGFLRRWEEASGTGRGRGPEAAAGATGDAERPERAAPGGKKGRGLR